MFEHVKRYGKAYATGGVTLAIGPFAADITTIVVWLISLFHVNVPDVVQAAFNHVIVALVAALTSAAVGNSAQNNKLELPK